jgi:DNA repair protein RAD7
VRQAEREAAADEPADELEEEDEYEDNDGETAEQRKKRKRKEAATLAKIKQSKEFARRKARRTGEPDDDDDVIAREMMYQKSRPMPGQLENCELCNKRFTVTPYSKTGPNGGLLCAKCSKEVADDERKSKAKKRGPRSGRRQNQSNLLDGIVQQGALSLVEMCAKVNIFDQSFETSCSRLTAFRKLLITTTTSKNLGTYRHGCFGALARYSPRGGFLHQGL